MSSISPPAPGGVPTIPLTTTIVQQQDGKRVPLPASWHLASGAMSGAASVLCLQPLDLIKTRIQQESKATTSSASTTTTVMSNDGTIRLQSHPSATHTKVNTPATTRVWSTTKLVVQQDGVRGLWRGTVPTLYRNVPGVSMYFLTLSRLRTFCGKFPTLTASSSTATTSSTKVKLTPVGDLIVGSTARTGVGFILMPFTLLKTLSESSLNSGKRLSTFQALNQLYAQGGLSSLWRGAVPTALRDAPNAGLFIVFYERMQTILGSRRLRRSQSQQQQQREGNQFGSSLGGGAAAGASASLFSTLLTTPFDLIKTRRQIDPLTYQTMWSSVKIVYRTSGVFGFWQGGMLRVVRKAGSAGIGWAVYEAVVGLGEKKTSATAMG
ncbi:hypothetical protein OIO90_002356 [Microbotryomycetes sp. JL221]|nr:hypothetical protein OIO90_002356 [Microbotryomycetes sp. JL221]